MERPPWSEEGCPPTLSWAAAALVTGSETGAPGWGRGGSSGLDWERVLGRSRVPGCKGPRNTSPSGPDSPAETCSFGESYSPTSHVPQTPLAAGLPKEAPTPPGAQDPQSRVGAKPHPMRPGPGGLIFSKEGVPIRVRSGAPNARPNFGKCHPRPGNFRDRRNAPELRVQNFGDTFSAFSNYSSRTSGIPRATASSQISGIPCHLSSLGSGISGSPRADSLSQARDVGDTAVSSNARTGTLGTPRTVPSPTPTPELRGPCALSSPGTSGLPEPPPASVSRTSGTPPPSPWP